MFVGNKKYRWEAGFLYSLEPVLTACHGCSTSGFRRCIQCLYRFLCSTPEHVLLAIGLLEEWERTIHSWTTAILFLNPL
jgi:hypothetical protein